MPERTTELASLVTSLLPYDHASIDINPDGEPEITDLLAASIATFTVASIFAFAKREAPTAGCSAGAPPP